MSGWSTGLNPPSSWGPLPSGWASPRATDPEVDDFLTCQPGHAIRVIAGQYENHMGILVGVLGSYIQVWVRKVIDLYPLGDKTDNGLYDLCRLLPGQLQIDRINDCARLEDAVRGMNFGDVQDLPALTLGVSNEVREAFAYLHRLQDQFALARHDPRLVKYTMDLATIIAADLHLMHRGRPTLVSEFRRAAQASDKAQEDEQDTTDDEA
eukprot:scaffold340925_cov30-Attheya_sp.AAC.1